MDSVGFNSTLIYQLITAATIIVFIIIALVFIVLKGLKK